MNKKMILSEKGKDWDGEPLNEDTLNAGVLVCFKGVVYSTGNRYHGWVELYQDKKLIWTVMYKAINLVKHDN
jgi:hypothetical protein